LPPAVILSLASILRKWEIAKQKPQRIQMSSANMNMEDSPHVQHFGQRQPWRRMMLCGQRSWEAVGGQRLSCSKFHEGSMIPSTKSSLYPIFSPDDGVLAT